MGAPLILVLGDVHGHWDIAAEHIRVAREIHGRLDAVFCVGDAQPFRNENEVAGMHCPPKYRTIGEFPRVISGEIQLAAPVWFIGGNHEPWPALDATGPGEWAPGVTFLGRAGVADVLGLRIAFLSRIYSQRVSEGAAKDRLSVNERTYWVREELSQISAIEGPIDLFITHDWPARIGTDRTGSATGHPDLARLAIMLQPKLYVCGHMHHRISAGLEGVRVEAVGHIRSGGDGSVLAEWGEDGVVLEAPLRIVTLPRS